MKNTILLFLLALSVSCTKQEFNMATTRLLVPLHVQVCGDPVWVGEYKVRSVSKLTWDGVEQWQAILEPVPLNTPAKTRRPHALITDSLEILENERFGMIRLD